MTQYEAEAMAMLAFEESRTALLEHSKGHEPSSPLPLGNSTSLASGGRF